MNCLANYNKIWEEKRSVTAPAELDCFFKKVERPATYPVPSTSAASLPTPASPTPSVISDTPAPVSLTPPRLDYFFKKVEGLQHILYPLPQLLLYLLQLLQLLQSFLTHLPQYLQHLLDWITFSKREDYILHDDFLIPNYTLTWAFERNFNTSEKMQWMSTNWVSSFPVSAAYVVLIFAIKAFMNSRQPLQLRGLLIVWNVSLAIFSLLGALRTMNYLVFSIRQFGLLFSVCNSGNHRMDNVFGFWTWMIVLSKAVELGDTVFIVLRKQPLTPLHWNHHAFTLVYSWYIYRHFSSIGRWFIPMNFVAHTMMYFYYALRAARIKVPRLGAVCVTSTQITQMFIGVYINLYVYSRVSQGKACYTSKKDAVISLMMYFYFFSLFCRFFYLTYIAPKKKQVGKEL